MLSGWISVPDCNDHTIHTYRDLSSDALHYIVGPLLLFLDQALSSHEMLEVQGFQAGTHAGGL